MFKFKLGENVREKITDFEGVIVARIDYLTGCNRYSVQTKTLYEGKPVEWQNFDENQLGLIKIKKPVKLKTDKIKGGLKPLIINNHKRINK